MLARRHLVVRLLQTEVSFFTSHNLYIPPFQFMSLVLASPSFPVQLLRSTCWLLRLLLHSLVHHYSGQDNNPGSWLFSSAHVSFRTEQSMKRASSWHWFGVRPHMFRAPLRVGLSVLKPVVNSVVVVCTTLTSRRVDDKDCMTATSLYLSVQTSRRGMWSNSRDKGCFNWSFHHQIVMRHTSPVLFASILLPGQPSVWYYNAYLSQRFLWWRYWCLQAVDICQWQGLLSFTMLLV